MSKVRNEAENYLARDRVKSLDSVTMKRSKKIKQTQSWVDYVTANNIGKRLYLIISP